MIGGRESFARDPQATRLRIVESAGRLFASRGFNGVGFRDIAARARVSLQMPNHHFGTKEKLFAECVRHAFLVRLDFPTIFADAPSPAKIGDKVRRCFVAIVPPSGRLSWPGGVVGRALTENLAGSLGAMQDGLKPSREWFYAALRCARPRLTLTEFTLWYGSLWAQVSFFVTARPAILARMGRKRYDPAFLRAAADYLVHTMLSPLRDGGRNDEDDD